MQIPLQYQKNFPGVERNLGLTVISLRKRKFQAIKEESLSFQNENKARIYRCNFWAAQRRHRFEDISDGQLLTRKI